MTLAAVMPTLRPSIWPLSWAARSSQWSARAGEAPDTVSANAASSASAVASRVDLRNLEFNVICECPSTPLKRPQAVGARVGVLPKLFVMAGLDPAIHAFLPYMLKRGRGYPRQARA